VADLLSLRILEDMFAERGFKVNHASLHHQACAVVRKNFSQVQRLISKIWRMDKTHIKVNGE